MTPFMILIVVALLLAVVAIALPKYPLIPVAILLVCVALLIGGR